MFGKKKDGGWECEQTPDGSQKCTRFEKGEDGQKLATGTEITLSSDENCQPVIGGDVSSIMDEDEDKIDKISQRITAKCKKNKGLA